MSSVGLVGPLGGFVVATACVLSGLPLMMVLTFMIPVTPMRMYLLVIKLLGQNVAPLWALMAISGAVVGSAFNAVGAVASGIVAALVWGMYIWGCARGHTAFEPALGPDWREQLPREGATRRLQGRFFGWLRPTMPADATWERDVSYWTIHRLPLDGARLRHVLQDHVAELSRGALRSRPLPRSAPRRPTDWGTSGWDVNGTRYR